MAISISELKPGDLIFDYYGTADTNPVEKVNPKAGPGGANGGLSHVSIVTESFADANTQYARHAHQVSSQGWKGSMHNDLIPAVKPVGIAQTGQALQRVLRCNREELAGKAGNYAKRWSQYKMPFATQREGFADSFERRFDSASDIVNRHRDLFHQQGKYRAIKYAARRNGPLSYPTDEDNIGKGMFCSMFVVVCFQVAGLEGVVKAHAGDANHRVSDKKMTDDQWKAFAKDSDAGWLDRVRYGNYLQKLKSLDPYDFPAIAKHPDQPVGQRKPGVSYTPGIACWDFSQEKSIQSVHWSQYLTTGMKVDCKIIHPTGLFASLMDDSTQWSDKGILSGAADHSESLAAKNQRLEDIAKRSTVLQQWYQ